MHVSHNLHVRKTRGQSLGVCCEIERLLEMSAADADGCKYG
jgi:hypothetical protein